MWSLTKESVNINWMMIIINSDLCLVIFSKMVDVWSHQAVDNINQWLHLAAFTVNNIRSYFPNWRRTMTNCFWNEQLFVLYESCSYDLTLLQRSWRRRSKNEVKKWKKYAKIEWPITIRHSSVRKLIAEQCAEINFFCVENKLQKFFCNKLL